MQNMNNRQTICKPMESVSFIIMRGGVLVTDEQMGVLEFVDNGGVGEWEG
jgi:hypothetical protein